MWPGLCRTQLSRQPAPPAREKMGLALRPPRPALPVSRALQMAWSALIHISALLHCRPLAPPPLLMRLRNGGDRRASGVPRLPHAEDLTTLYVS